MPEGARTGQAQQDAPRIVSLMEIVRQATARRFLVPPLQRGPVWGAPDQKLLLSSVLAGRPIGSLLTVGSIVDEAGENAVPRALQLGIDRMRAAPEDDQDALEEGDPGRSYVLDGQQRLIALASGFMPAAPSRGRQRALHRDARVWLLDLDALLQARLAPGNEWVDACTSFERALSWRRPRAQRGVLASELAEACLSAAERGDGFRLQPGMLLAPAGKLQQRVDSLLDAFVASHAGNDAERAECERIREQLRLVRHYRIPVFSMTRCTALEAASIFERINDTGERLTSGQLASAHVFVRDVRVRARLLELARSLAAPDADGRGLGVAGIGEDELILVGLCAGTPTGEPIPNLRANSVLKLVKQAEGVERLSRGLERLDSAVELASKLLVSNGVRGRMAWPVPAVSLALVAAIARIPDPARYMAVGANRSRLSRWWWDRNLRTDDIGTTHTAIVRLCEQVEQHVRTGQPLTEAGLPWTLEAFGLDPDHVRTGARAKALVALLRMQGLRDFRDWEARPTSEALDLHHVFPRAWLSARNRLRAGDCFTNLTLIGSDTNRNFIRALAPSAYVRKMMQEAGHGAARHQLASVLAGHGISIEALETDDFERFMVERRAWFGGLVAHLGTSLLA